MSGVPIKNVYHMLIYAFEALKSKEYERLDNEKCEDVYDLLASLLLCGTHSLIKRGFLKSYVNQTEELSSIKGRVDIGRSVRKLTFQNAKAICIFDEFSSNIYFNQILKAAFLCLKRRTLQKDIARDVKKILMYFGEIETISLNSIKWDNFAFNRNNAHYDTLLYFCRLICEEAVANQNKGKKDFRTIEDNLLPSLFERFIFTFYKKHLSCSVSFQQQIKWRADYFDMLPKMNADTIIESACLKLIIDTKFYSKTLQSNRFNDNQTIISSNLYQIFAYVKNEAANTTDKAVSGMLLYPQVDVPLEKSYTIDGHNFYVRTVDLNQEFEAIRRQLMSMAECTVNLRKAEVIL